MPLMIPVHLVGGRQFLKARDLMSPVIFNGTVFQMPSSSGGEEDHLTRFDNLESPLLCSCTCRAGRTGTPCWAMARALDVLTLLSVNKVFVGPAGPAPGGPVAIGPSGPPLRASIDENGEMALLTRSETELAGVVLNIP